MAECGVGDYNFSDCVVNPIAGLDAADTFTSLSSTLVYSINITYFIVNSILIILVGYFIVKTIYSLYGGGADTAESYEKFKNGILNAVLAVICILIVANLRFFFVFFFNVLGIPADENIFGDIFPF